MRSGKDHPHSESPHRWERVSPSDAGFTPDLIARLDQFAGQDANQNLHGVVVIRGGKLVAERYYPGVDQRWGEPLGTVAFTAETLHDLRSVSKSIVGLLYGIALDEQRVPPIDQQLLDALSDYADLKSDPARCRLTVAHALSMQLGLEWNEDLPYSDPRNSEIAMEQSPDRYRYVLERPIVDEPGTRWTYSGGATALLARLLTQGTGMSLLEYARTKLLTPLGIEHAEWVADEHGTERAASGLRMRPSDLAKIGQLVLDRGRLGDEQLIPESWIEASLTPHARIDEEFNYGYQWWLPTRWNWVGAFGNGGQRINVLPRLGIVLVVTAGNYNQSEQWKVPVGVLVDVVLASLV